MTDVKFASVGDRIHLTPALATLSFPVGHPVSMLCGTVSPTKDPDKFDESTLPKCLECHEIEITILVKQVHNLEDEIFDKQKLIRNWRHALLEKKSDGH